MKSSVSALCLSIAGWFFFTTAPAIAAPPIITHQGRLAVDGVAFTGTGRIKLALVNAGGTRTHWSHDGSSVNGSEPGTALAVNVTGGHYTVAPGDVSVTGMAALPVNIFAQHDDVWLRVWFSHLPAGALELLTPDQRLTSAPFALSAATVAEFEISRQIGGNGSAAAGALSFGRETLAVVFPDAFAGVPQLQAVLDGFDPLAGPAAVLDVSGLTATGFSAQAPFGRVRIGRSAVQPSGAMIAGRPAIAFADYTDEPPSSEEPELIFAIAGSPRGQASTWNQVRLHVALDRPSSLEKLVQDIQLAPLANGGPAIIYRTPSLGYSVSSAVDGVSGTWTSRILAGEVDGAALATVQGFPAIAYIDPVAGELRYMRAANATGATGSWGSRSFATLGAVVHCSLAFVSGRPAIAYIEDINGAAAGGYRLGYARASNSTGIGNASPWSLTVLALPSVGAFGSDCQLLEVDGRPAIAFNQTDGSAFQGVKWLRSLDADGTTWPNSPGTIAFDASNLFPFERLNYSIAVSGGRPFAMLSRNPDDSNQLRELWYIRASNAQGSGLWESPVFLLDDASGHRAFDLNGRPAVTWDTTLTGFPGSPISVHFASIAPVRWSATLGDGTPITAMGVADNAVDSAALADGSVTAEKLALGGEPGAVLFSTGTGVEWSDAGAEGAVLTRRSDGTVHWSTAAQGVDVPGGGRLGKAVLRTSGDALLMDNGARCTAGGVWQNASDRALKENLTPVDAAAVLEKVAALPLTEWNYLTEPDSTRHLGPMAQDFREAFGLGDSEKSIGTVDADGVALAAIQALKARSDAQQQQIEHLTKLVEQLTAVQK